MEKGKNDLPIYDFEDAFKMIHKLTHLPGFIIRRVLWANDMYMKKVGILRGLTDKEIKDTYFDK